MIKSKLLVLLPDSENYKLRFYNNRHNKYTSYEFLCGRYCINIDYKFMQCSTYRLWLYINITIRSPIIEYKLTASLIAIGTSLSISICIIRIFSVSYHIPFNLSSSPKSPLVGIHVYSIHLLFDHS